MKLTKYEWSNLVIILLAILIGVYFYPLLPEKIASHWNMAGQVDGYMSRFWGTFLMPIIAIIMYVLFLVVPRVDPKKENIAKFKKYFDQFITLIFLFLFYIYLLTLAWSLGLQFNIVPLLIPALSVLFLSMGELLSKADMNWSIGIRTPWTLSNEKVWQATHQLGSKLFYTCGVINLLGFIWPTYAFWLAIIPILISVIYLIIYSYYKYRQIK